MNVYRVIAFLIIILFPWESIAQTTIVLQPDSVNGKDAFVWTIDPANNSNRGNYPKFHAMAWTWNSVPGMVRSYIDFDLSSIPSGTSILNASLTLFHCFPPGMPSSITGHSQLSGTNETTIRRVVSAWSEDSITWNNQPTSIAQNEVIFPSSTSPTQDYFINVTSIVQDMVNNPSNSHGFQFKLQTESFYRAVFHASSNHIDYNKHPKLEITYVDTCFVTVYDTVTFYDTVLVSVTDTLIIDVFTGLSAPNNYNTITVYPNPTNNLLFIDNGNFSLIPNHSLQIINSSGQQVFNSIINVPAFTVNMSQFGGPGLYFLQILNSGNQIIQEKKIILQ